MATLKLTKRAVEALPAPESGRTYHFDTELKGFGVSVTSNGAKSFIVQYRPGSGGRSAPKRRMTIGNFGSVWTVDTARDEARRLLGLVANGHDPAKEQTEARHAQIMTVEAVGEMFIDKYAKKNQRDWNETERVFRRDIYPAIGKINIKEVSKRDIVDIIDRIEVRGPIMANRTLAYVRKFFNWCCEKDYIPDSPCRGIKPPAKPVVRDRVLSDDELKAVWRAAETVGGVWESIVKLLILTAQRREEVTALSWNEIDLEACMWTLPAERAKNGTAHQVPLVNTAMTILNAIKRSPAKDALVFTTTGTTPVSGLSKAKLRLDRAAADAFGEPLPNWTYHDLRRTATTGMARLGVAPQVADAVLNHKSGTIRGVAAIYNRHAYLDERRQALKTWEDHVLKVLGV